MSRSLFLCLVLVAFWILLQVVYRGMFIYHDSWRAGFPILFNFARQGTCGGLATWIAGVDTGSPMILYVLSFSLTHAFRLPALYVTGCLQLGLTPAVYLTKIQIVLTYLALSASMYVLGCLLFQRRLAAVYLMTATLYAGLFLDVMHSDQVATILFWIPWAIASTVLACRQRTEPAGGWYLNASIIFLCVQALDQYPHFPLLVALVGGGVAAGLWPREAWQLLRHQARRLWPAAIVLLATALQLAVISGAVMSYRPGQNRELIVNPATFDETGFVQPTALIGSFLPLGFLAGFETLASGMAQWVATHSWFAPRRGFIFRLDSLLFNLGFIPTVLGIAFVLRPDMRRIRLWWFATTTMIFLVSLQQSRLYLLLFHLPFFNVFRAYFLYIAFVIFASLIMSGYGMDAYLTLEANERRRMLRQSLLIVTGLTALSGACVVWLLNYEPHVGSRLPAALRYARIDLLIAATGATLIWLAGRGREPKRWATILIVAVALSGAAYSVGVYRLVGMSLPKVVETYGLNQDDLTPVAADVAGDPNSFRRKPCTSFAECYASLRDTATIARFEGEWRGAFWRSKDDAIFQDGVRPSVVAALAGVTQPVFWLSRRAVPYSDRAELISRLNGQSTQLGEYLKDTVNVRASDLDKVVESKDVPVGRSSLTSLTRDRDHFWLSYETEGPTILNAAVTYDRHWVARVNGQQRAVVRGNFNGLAVPLPTGTGIVELAYESWASRTLFGSRYLILLLAVVLAAWITRTVLEHARDA